MKLSEKIENMQCDLHENELEDIFEECEELEARVKEFESGLHNEQALNRQHLKTIDSQKARIKELEEEIDKVYKALDHLPIDIDELLGELQ